MKFLLLSLISISNLFAQGVEYPHLGRFISTPYGIVFTNDRESSLLICEDNTIQPIINSHGSGRYFTVSNDGRYLGFKEINQSGSQRPLIYDLFKQDFVYLDNFTSRAGQPGFLSDGRVFYTYEESLIIRDNISKSEYPLGEYVNLVSIDSSGFNITYAGKNDKIIIKNLYSGEVKYSGISGMQPQWINRNQILIQGLNGTIGILNVNDFSYIDLGKGTFPFFDAGNNRIFFSVIESEMGLLKSSDIWVLNLDDLSRNQVTDTKNIIELYTYFSPHTEQLLCSDAISTNIFTYKYTGFKIYDPMEEKKLGFTEENNLPPLSNYNTLNEATLNLPYVNQVYDTPDWFNGHSACGPTTGIMILAYYNILPKWEGWCSWPFPGHYNSYGRYVCESYRYRMIDYSLTANDPNGNPGKGGYGFMWSGSYSPYSRMVTYYSNHRLSAQRTDAPSFMQISAEIDSGYPYSLCNGLTTAGHIIAVSGYNSSNKTIIANDPYGNKNLPGYPNYQGKNAVYDWPGYNNGYQNLNQIYWGVSSRFKEPIPPDTLIDDYNIERGFYLHNKTPATMSRWRDMNAGYGGHFWYTYTTDSNSSDTCYAIWRPTLADSGYYEVKAYISFSNAMQARYKITHAQGMTEKIINQKDVTNNWISLGTYFFHKGSMGSVRLGDASGIKGQELVFDAIAWFKRDITVNTEHITSDFQEKSYLIKVENFPNPFNNTTKIRIFNPMAQSSRNNKYEFLLVNSLGEVITGLEKDFSGEITEFEFNTERYNIPSGIYLLILRSENKFFTHKLNLLK